MKRNLLALIIFFSFQIINAQIYQDISAQAGIANPNNKNHGIAFADFDKDGDQDFYAFTRLNENKLFVNEGNNEFTDYAQLMGVNHNESTRAAAWGDLNNDGWLDLYIGNYQENDVLYLSNGSNGSYVTFSDITLEAGIYNNKETISVHFADVDGDGWLDIYVANFNADNKLYRNNGDETFTDFTNQAGVNDDTFSMGCVFFDYDKDGDSDLYLVHDFNVPNILYQNDGTGHFTNVAASVGVDVAGHGMGVDVADINHDGWMDIYITDLDENVLYLNNTDGTFTNIAESAGVDDVGMGWSTMFLDFDNDGWVDIYVVNDSDFSPEPNVLYRNNGDLTFSIMDANGAISSAGAGVGGACADINNDGAMDIAVANTFSSEGNQLFLNNGNSNYWIAFQLTGTQANYSAIGTRVEIEYGNGLTQIDEVMAGTGFAGANSLNIHFGLKEFDTVDKLTVYWAGGDTEEFFNLESNQIHQITEVQMPEINSLTVQDSVVEQYSKFECALELTATYDNPYNFDEIVVSTVFIAPDGSQKTADGFFMQDYDLNTINGAITEIGDGGFKVRFSPGQIGEWTYQITVTDLNGTTTFDEQTFECTPPTSPNNNGFVRTGQTNYLEFDNGEQLILIGENMAWENSNPYTNYKNWLTKLDDNGGNFIRLWHAHWGLGIEWEAGWQSFEGLRKYKESNCFYQDWLYDFCAEKGIYVMLALQHHGPVSSNVNPNWNESPYNTANGGPCQNTWDFFTDETAIAHTKNRYRYILARWGYSRAIQSWELFNEVEWTDNYETHKEKVQDWHADMASYLKTIDPYQHSVTTSYAHSNEDPVVWNNPDIDFTQTHYYINTSNIERALAGGVRQYLTDFEKPTLTGEFGLGGSPNLSNADPDGIHFHNAMWGALFGGGMGTGMTWWWDVYVHPRDLYYHFAPIRTITDAIPFVEEDLKPAVSFVQGAPGDLILTPSLGWGVVGDENITINTNGTTDPANPGLSQYLYGSQWNTQYRSPPNFSVNYPEEGEFTITTGNDNGTNPKVSIYLNGSLILNESFQPNTEFSILVPPGSNLIKVDNLGTDWMTVASYNFTGVGSKVDSYSLVSENSEQAAGWVFNHAYNHITIDEVGEPESVINSELVIENFTDGDYYVKWYDCLTGEIVWADAANATGGQLFLPIPELHWDLAFRVDDEELIMNTESVVQALDFEVFPNPAKAGEVLRVELGEEDLEEDIRVSVLDVGGRMVLETRLNGGTFQLPDDISSGFYWVKLNGLNGFYSKGIVVDLKL